MVLDPRILISPAQIFQFNYSAYNIWSILHGLRKVIQPLYASVFKFVKQKENSPVSQECGEGGLQLVYSHIRPMWVQDQSSASGFEATIFVTLGKW